MAAGKKIDFNAVLTAHKDPSGKVVYYLDTRTGAVVALSPTTPMAQLVKMKERMKSDPDSLLKIPHVTQEETYADMDAFIAHTPDKKLQERLKVAKSGGGTLRNFLDVLMAYPKQEGEWKAFREQKVQGRLKDWLRNLGLLAVLLCLVLLCAAPAFAAPQVVLKVVTTNPLDGPLEKLTSLPQFVLRDDGSVFFERPAREVGKVSFFTAQLSPDEVHSVQQMLEYASPDDWDDSYENADLKDLPTTSVTVHVGKTDRTVSIYGAAWCARQKLMPGGLIQIWQYVTTFTHSTERAFVPTRATLYVKQMGLGERLRSMSEAKWRLKKVHLDAGDGVGEYRRISLAGDMARQVWQELNGLALPTMAAPRVYFTQNHHDYRLGVRPVVPGEE
ncbi:MAG: UPF0158 family protein [Candidatus Xenobia bacterium]